MSVPPVMSSLAAIVEHYPRDDVDVDDKGGDGGPLVGHRPLTAPPPGQWERRRTPGCRWYYRVMARHLPFPASLSTTGWKAGVGHGMEVRRSDEDG